MFVRPKSSSGFISSPYPTNSGGSGLPMGVYIGIGCAIFAVVLFVLISSICLLRKRSRNMPTRIVPGTLSTGPAPGGPMGSVGRVVQNQPAQSTAPNYQLPTAPPPTYSSHRLDKVYQVVWRRLRWKWIFGDVLRWASVPLVKRWRKLLTNVMIDLCDDL